MDYQNGSRQPSSPTDLEQLKGELAARANEERDILLVCLGKELACEPWLTEWGRLRKCGDVPNKIEIIELRTDPKYELVFAGSNLRPGATDKAQAFIPRLPCCPLPHPISPETLISPSVPSSGSTPSG